MVATLQAFHAGHYLWHSDWLQLLSLLEALNPLLSASTAVKDS